MRRMDLDHPHPKVEDSAHLTARIALVSRVHRSDRQQAAAMIASETRDPVVHFACESHDFGSDVVDAAGALDFVLIEKSDNVVRG